MSSLLTQSQSVSLKRFHQCVNHKKNLSLGYPLLTFGSFSFFHAFIWLGVDKILQKLAKCYESYLRHLFQCYILIPRHCLRKTPFQHSAPRPPRPPQLRQPDVPHGLYWSKFISLIKYLSMFSGHVWPFISIASDYDGRGACLRLFLRSHAETQKEFHGGRSSYD